MNKIIIQTLLLLISLNCLGQESKLNITIDERIETLYAVAYFDDYFLINNHENLYKNTLKNKLQGLKDHKAVQLFDSLSTKYNFSYYRTVEWILQFSNFPEFQKVKEKADNYSTVPENKKYLLEEFRKELIKFNQDTLFQKYLKAVKPLNEKVISQVKNSETIDKLPSFLEDYYGKKLNSYNLILSPLIHAGGFNSEIINKNGESEVYAILGPNGEIDFVPYFDKDFIETDLILHEFGHSFVNPLIEKYSKEVETLNSKYYSKELKENAKNQGYSEWKYVFNELLLRATTIHITEQKFGKEKAEKLLEFEKSIGFGLVEKILDILKDYELNRTKYETFDEFYPILINRMK